MAHRPGHRSRPAAAIYAHTSSWRAADLASSEGNGVGVRAISPSELPDAAAGEHAAPIGGSYDKDNDMNDNNSRYIDNFFN